MDNLCRTCLGTANLFSIREYESLADKIEVISAIQISLDAPNYPTTICEDCVDKVNQFYCFRKVIINSDKELRERIYLLKNKLSEKKSTSTKRKSTCDKPIKTRFPRKRRRIQSKVVSTSTPDTIKTEPTEDDHFVDPLVVCDTENNIENDVKPEIGVSDLHVNILDCEDCNVTFYSKSEFDNHNKTDHKYHKKAKSLDCEECNITFSSLADVSNHKRKVHTAPGICNICGVIVRADNLRKHVQRHSEEPVACKICSKILKNSESLRGHLLIHKGTSYECKECDKTFRIKSEYNRHLKKHEDPNVRKKMCTICGKHVRDMQRHLFTHTGERPYVCSYCNKGLTSTYALKLHIRQHTNEKPFICEFCSKGFAQKVSLLAHLKSKAHG